jgi:hypothetical protein
MLTKLVDKQRRAVAVVKEAMRTQGLPDRSVCVTVESWSANTGNYENCAVFIQSGGDHEPSYETGVSIVEAVKKTVDFLKGRLVYHSAPFVGNEEEALF